MPKNRKGCQSSFVTEKFRFHLVINLEVNFFTQGVNSQFAGQYFKVGQIKPFSNEKKLNLQKELLFPIIS